MLLIWHNVCEKIAKYVRHFDYMRAKTVNKDDERGEAAEKGAGVGSDIHPRPLSHH